MADPITTILTTAAEHAPSAAAVTVALKAAKDFLAKVAGPAVEELGEIGRDYVKGWRAKNGNAVLAGADKLLAEAGREPQAVPLKTLLPLLDAASLEDEPTLAEKWAALLANAADPAHRIIIKPGFVDVLRQLTPMDAKVLVLVYQQAPVNFADPNYDLVLAWTTNFRDDLGLSYGELATSIDELVRLRLCEVNTASFVKLIDPIEQLRVVDSVYPTAYGADFLAAVTPPTP